MKSTPDVDNIDTKQTEKHEDNFTKSCFSNAKTSNIQNSLTDLGNQYTHTHTHQSGWERTHGERREREKPKAVCVCMYNNTHSIACVCVVECVRKTFLGGKNKSTSQHSSLNQVWAYINNILLRILF